MRDHCSTPRLIDAPGASHVRLARKSSPPPRPRPSGHPSSPPERAACEPAPGGNRSGRSAPQPRRFGQQLEAASQSAHRLVHRGEVDRYREGSPPSDSTSRLISSASRGHRIAPASPNANARPMSASMARMLVERPAPRPSRGPPRARPGSPRLRARSSRSERSRQAPAHSNAMAAAPRPGSSPAAGSRLRAARCRGVEQARATLGLRGGRRVALRERARQPCSSGSVPPSPNSMELRTAGAKEQIRALGSSSVGELEGTLVESRGGLEGVQAIAAVAGLAERQPRRAELVARRRPDAARSSSAEP